MVKTMIAGADGNSPPNPKSDEQQENRQCFQWLAAKLIHSGAIRALQK